MHLRSFPGLPAVGLALALTAPARADAPPPRAFTVQDLVTLQRVSEPEVSPDGAQVAFVLRSTDLEANKGRTDLWMVGADGTNPRQLTFSPESESSPRWAKDGKSLFFLSTRGGSQQLWSLPLDGGEARPVTQLPLDVGAYTLSPDGTRLLLSMDVFVDCESVQCTRERLDTLAKSKTTGQLYENLLYRHWDSFRDGRRAHLFVMPLAGGEPVDVMKGMNADAPSKPWGGAEEFTFTPDGESVIFTARDEGREEAWSTNFDLFLAPADGKAAPRRLTEKNKAWDTEPTFSPDGKTLAYKAMSVPGYEADRFRIMLRAWPSGEERELAAHWDRSATGLVWSPDGKTLFTTADNLGNHSLFAIDVASGRVRELSRDGHNVHPTIAGDRVFFAQDHLRSPAQILSVKVDGSGLTRLTRINEERLAGVQLGETEQFTFKGWKGETVYGWLTKPVGFQPGVKYPVAFIIHGGPQNSMGNSFHYRWNPQIYAAAGYAAVMIDFHGSTGYGQKFSDSIRGDWGGKPLEDLQKGLAAAVKKYPFLDGDRVSALGASYGGYMINWIAGAWPDRFRSLVAHDGNLDEQFAYFGTEELWFPEREHGGPPWENPKAYQKHNPINLVKNWKTPIFVIHGGKDFRVVDTQGMATFTAAQRRGIPSQFLHFPDENHWVLKPHNSILWHESVLKWLDRWTK